MNDLQAAIEKAPSRAKIFDLEKWILAECAPLEIKYVDHFSHGVYGREMIVPAGAVVTGDIHKFENMNVLLEGRMSVLTEDGVKTVESGFMIVSPPGTKRVAYCHTACRWLTIHGTFETDVSKIEAHFIAHNEQEFIEFCEEQKLLKGE